MKNVGLQAGFARVNINPPLGIDINGYYVKRYATGILDDLEANAVALKNGDKSTLLMSLDNLGTDVNYLEIRQEIEKRTGIPVDAIFIHCTHTHTAPLTGLDPNSDVYNAFVGQKAAEAFKDALANMEEGEIYTTVAFDSRFIFNRRYWMKDGRVVTNPGKLNPNIARPEGDIDPEIPMIAIRNADGIKVLFTAMVNHTDTIGGCGVSADWPGFLRRKVEPQLAPGAMMVTMVGTSGNINHFDVSTDMDQTCYAEPERIGHGYAETVLAALDKLAPISGTGFKVKSQKVSTGVREVDPEEIAAAREIVAKYPDIDVNSPDSVKDLTSEDLAKGTPFALKYFANALLKIVDKKNGPEFVFGAVIHYLP